MVTLLKNDPLLESIRDKPEFQQIVTDVETKYEASREQVRKWREENKMLKPRNTRVEISPPSTWLVFL